MALPTLSKTWRFGVNRSRGPGATGTVTQNYIMIDMVDGLTGGGSWTDSDGVAAAVVNPLTIVAACGRVTGLVGAGVNPWTSDAETFIGNYGGTGNRPWILLQNVDGAQILFAVVSSSNNILIHFSPGGLFTGGTATAIPTATDGIVIAASTSFGQSNSNTTTVQHFLISTDGRSLRWFVCQAGNVMATYHLERLQNPRAGHTNPYVFGYVVSSGGSSPNNHTITGAGGMLSNASSAAMWTRHNSTGVRVAYSCPGSGSTLLPAQITSANELDAAPNDWPLWALGCYCTTTGSRGVAGKPHDVWVTSWSRAQGDGLPDATDPGGARQFAYLGYLVYPWNKQAINLS